MGIDLTRWEIRREWTENKRKFVEVTCTKCGEHVQKIRKEALSGKTPRKCECYRPKISSPLQPGDRFGRLVVVEKDTSWFDGKTIKWFVQCDCGTTKSIQGSQLTSGSTISCGCYRDELIGRPRENHGMSGTKEFNTWLGIKSRTGYACESTRKWYFDKGIEMSEDWRNSFIKFYEDMGPCPEGCSIDRIDPDGDYCKENCRWASLEMQSINKGVFSNNTSGTTGVHETKHGTFQAYIYVNYKQIHLGTFKTKGEAINARKTAEQKYWGDINE